VKLLHGAFSRAGMIGPKGTELRPDPFGGSCQLEFLKAADRPVADSADPMFCAHGHTRSELEIRAALYL